MNAEKMLSLAGTNDVPVSITYEDAFGDRLETRPLLVAEFVGEGEDRKVGLLNPDEPNHGGYLMPLRWVRTVTPDTERMGGCQ